MGCAASQPVLDDAVNASKAAFEQHTFPETPLPDRFSIKQNVKWRGDSAGSQGEGAGEKPLKQLEQGICETRDVTSSSSAGSAADLTTVLADRSSSETVTSSNEAREAAREATDEQRPLQPRKSHSRDPRRCSGQAIAAVAAVTTFHKTDAARGSVDINRRQSHQYMREVDNLLGGWDIQGDEITILKNEDGSDAILGRGSYGQVYHGLRGGVQDVAVKVLFDADEKALKSFVQEISLLKSLNYDRNIVQFYGARLAKGQTCFMVTEYMEGGNLLDGINDDFQGHLKWNAKGYTVALDIIRGLCFLHSHNVIHSDLKSSNILLDRSKSTAKISDMGLGRVMQHKEYRSSEEHAWTFVYAAPELLMGKVCTSASDIFSLGVVLWELVMRELPVRGRLARPKCPEDCPQGVSDLIFECLKKDPTQRPTARDVFDRIKAAHAETVKSSAWFG